MQIHMQVLRVRISQYIASILFIAAKETEAIIWRHVAACAV